LSVLSLGIAVTAVCSKELHNAEKICVRRVSRHYV
jgi:hypothetical protein